MSSKMKIWEVCLVEDERNVMINPDREVVPETDEDAHLPSEQRKWKYPEPAVAEPFDQYSGGMNFVDIAAETRDSALKIANRLLQIPGDGSLKGWRVSQHEDAAVEIENPNEIHLAQCLVLNEFINSGDKIDNPNDWPIDDWVNDVWKKGKSANDVYPGG